MSWWIGLSRRQLVAIATVETNPTPLDRCVPLERFRMDGTRIAEQRGSTPPLIGQWNQRPRRPRRSRTEAA